MRKNRVYIQRSAVISPLGDDPVSMGNRLDSGEIGIRRIADLPAGSSVSDPGAAGPRVVGVTSFDTRWELRKDGPKFLAVLSALFSQIRRESPLELDAIVLATHLYKYDELIDALPGFLRREPDSQGSGLKDEIRKRAMAQGYRLKADAEVLHFSTICSSGISGLGLAFRRIRQGDWKRAVVCCIDLVDTARLVEMGALGVLALEDDVAACRPFGANRGGMVCAGGAGLCLLESNEISTQEPEAEIFGHGHTSDAWRLTDGREDGAQVARAIRQSIEDAGLDRARISLVKAHGTGTFLNDQLEHRALREVFEERLPSLPVTALKSQLGHSTEASGIVELVACIQMLKRGRIFPVPTVTEIDPEFRLKLIMKSGISADLEYIICNAIGFGGHNASIIIGKVGI